MTTPTRSMARMAHSPPSPPPSAARLEENCILSSTLVSTVGVVVSVLDGVSRSISSFVVCVSVSVVCVSSSVVCVSVSVVCISSSVVSVSTSVVCISVSVVCISIFVSVPMEDDLIDLCATVLSYMLDIFGHQLTGL